MPCPGCGVDLAEADDIEGPADTSHHASAGCWRLYGEAAAWTLTLGDPAFPHQYLVDAYAAQHVGPAMRSIAPAFALIGLHLAFDRGFTGHRVQRAHMGLARTKRPWPQFTAPTGRVGRTVGGVIAAGLAEREAELRGWAQAVWNWWPQTAHAWAEEVCRPITH